MLGPWINAAGIAVGSLIGAMLGGSMPKRVRESMPLTCGLVSIGIGAALMNKVNALPAMALALLLGTLIGEICYLERGLEKAVGWCQRQFERVWPAEKDNPRAHNFISKFVTVLVLFSASGTGMFGALREGMTGDPSILVAKALLDFITAAIFSAELGLAVAFIAIPQTAIQGGLHAAGGWLLPLVNPAMLGDFAACGGVIMIATGLRICGIKIFPIVNMLPALLLAMPCSALWMRFGF